MRLNRWLLSLLLSMCSLWTFAETQTPPAVSPPMRAPSAIVAPGQTVAGTVDDQMILSNLKTIATSIEAIKSKPPDYVPAYLAFGSGLLGTLVGSLVSWSTQSRSLKSQALQAERAAEHARQLAEARAKLEIGNSFVQWRLKQLSELYGPLHALLRQSNALYRLMNEALISAARDQFRLVQGGPSDDFDGKVFEIATGNDQWERFRTVLHLSRVYGAGKGIEDYFDELVEIGRRIVEIIEGKAGLAREDQHQDLMPVFGRYLAHYRVFKQLHAHAKKSQGEGKGAQVDSGAMPVGGAAVFPKEIQGLVDEGYKNLVSELNAWRAKAG